MKKQLILIILISISLNLFAEMSVKSFYKVEKDMDARIDAKKLDQNGEVCAIIKVETTQTGFTWDSDASGITAVVPKVGEYWIYVPNGAKRLTIKHPQLGILRDYFYPLPIEKATVYVLSLVSGKITTIVEETIESQWLIIRPKPANALIYIDDVFVSRGEYSTKLKPGSHTYRVEASLYHSDAGKLEIADSKKEMDVVLSPAFGYLQINSTPESGAKIIIDGKELKQSTPAQSDTLASGDHKVQLIKDMYQPCTQKVQVVDWQVTPVDFILQPSFAQISINSVANASIIINGVNKGIGTWKGRLNAGVYSLEASLDKHRTAKQDIELVAGDVKTIDLKPIPIIGSIDINSTPFGATINIDGKDYGKTPETVKLLIGVYPLKLSLDGYNDLNKTITIKESENDKLTFQLSKGRLVTIKSFPTGVNLFVDNRSVGTTPYQGELTFGNHKLKIEHVGRVTERSVDILQYGGITTFDLEFNYQLVNIKSFPSNASVFIDGKYIGKSPQFTKIAFGKHSIEIDNGEKSAKQVLDFDNQSMTEFSYVLEECNESKQISSYPGGASVYIGNKNIGNTPLTYKMKHKQEEMKIKLSGYLQNNQLLTCDGENTINASLNLKPEKKELTLLEVGAVYPLVTNAKGGITDTGVGLQFKVGNVKNIGWYLKFTIHSPADTSYISLNKIPSGMYYKTATLPAKSDFERLGFVGGLMFNFSPIIVYAGGGYGSYKHLIKTDLYYTKNESLYKSTQLEDKNTFENFETDAGLIINLSPFSISVGASSIGFKYSEVTCGIGLLF